MIVTYEGNNRATCKKHIKDMILNKPGYEL